jgi:hypothetical protein
MHLAELGRSESDSRRSRILTKDEVFPTFLNTGTNLFERWPDFKITFRKNIKDPDQVCYILQNTSLCHRVPLQSSRELP